MAIKQLLEAFEGEDALPVDLAKVQKWIHDQGTQDDIEFVGVELDIGVIRGFLYRFTYHKVAYGDPVFAANIYYAVNQPDEWIHLVCAKELLHLVDGKQLTGKKAQFDELVHRLVLPRELDILLDDPKHIQLDKLGDVIAAGLVLPMAARNKLMAAYEKGDITAQDISRWALLPVSYVRMVMSDRWEKLYDVFKQL